MTLSSIRKAVALTAFAALAACGGGGSGNASAVLPGREAAPRQGAVLTQIVAVGDSLTAGYQADGFLGATTVKNPLYPGKRVHPSQENGWWALLDEQASGKPLETAIAQIYDPNISPLPLIQGPGLDNQIVPAGPSPFSRSVSSRRATSAPTITVSIKRDICFADLRECG